MFTIISGNKYTTAEEMMNEFRVTDRTIRTDIKNLNSELKKYDCEIILKRKVGYYLSINNQEKYHDLINKIRNTPEQSSINSMDDRIKYILKEKYIDISCSIQKPY